MCAPHAGRLSFGAHSRPRFADAWRHSGSTNYNRRMMTTRATVVCALLVVGAAVVPSASVAAGSGARQECVAAWNARVTPVALTAVVRIHATRALVLESAVYSVPASTKPASGCMVTLFGNHGAVQVIGVRRGGVIRFSGPIPLTHHSSAANAVVSNDGTVRLRP
jgi:hypothetical protein